MGDFPDKVENIYCSRCEKVTEHNIYKKTKYESYQPPYYDDYYYYYYRPPEQHTYEMRKEVCNICGKTKKRRTEEDCCLII